MEKIVVIGAGASGLATAISLARNNCKVLVLEKNSVAGKKLLLTGNGKCNLGNVDQDIKHYYSSSDEYKKLITKENIDKANRFINSLGFIIKEKNGCLYPNSNQASTVLDSLLYECKRLDVEIKYNFLINNIKYNKKFIIEGSEMIECDNLVLACGSCAYPKTGSDGFGYKFIKTIGHNLIPVKPALVSLIADEYYLQNWSGVRQDVEVGLVINGEIIKKEIGEIQLTDYGVSGICIMQLSNMAIKALDDDNSVTLSINFLPGYNTESLYKIINNTMNEKSLIEIVSGIVNKKLAYVIIELCKLSGGVKWKALSEKQKQEVISRIVDFSLHITGSRGFDNAQTVSGGVDLSEIDLNKMESKIIPKLFFVGEIIDCNGDCGGYNLTLAWLTACLVGECF